MVTGGFNYSVNNGKWDILKSEMYGVPQAHVQDNFAKYKFYHTF